MEADVMTLPIERTRALRLGWEFLWGLRSAGILPADQHCTIGQVLAHYPTPEEISAWAQSSAANADHILGSVTWLEPEPPVPEPLWGTSGAPYAVVRAPVTLDQQMHALLTANVFLNEDLRGMPNLTPEQHRTRNSVCRHFPQKEEVEALAQSVATIRARSSVEQGDH